MEFFGSMMDSGSSEDGEELYVLLDSDENFARKKRGALHDAVERGDVETVTRILSPPPIAITAPGEDGSMGVGEESGGVLVMGDGMMNAEERRKEEQKLVNVRLLSQKDLHECTPLYVALLNSELDCLKVLLDHGARVHQKLEGSLPLHVAVQVASLDHVQEKHGGVFGVDAIKMLVEYGCVVLDRDDHGRTPLHWAAALGLVDECACLVELGKKLMQEQPDTLEENPFDAPPLWDFQDKQGNLAVHLAARYGNVGACRLLVDVKPEAVSEKNKGGLSVAHMVAIGGNVECAKALLDHHDVSYLNTLVNRRMQSPAEVAEKRGCLNVAAVLRGHADAHAEPPSTPTKRQREKKTLIVAPPECLEHYTAPWPMSRDDDAPPPENVNRLHVLTNPEIGSLRTRVFRDGALLWDQKSRRATMADVLKVHDWAYVLKLKTASECIQDDPGDIRHLDGDTAISHGTYRAALAAAGAVCHAVDEVMSGKAKNAFCPVRPPGHHAGPHGVVTSRMDPNGSHGFCLLNNVAIGAAYAMSVYRHAGIKKVAILDFDVHHGNGTEACVANTAPSLDTFEFATPYGKGTQTFPIYKPWCDDNDKDNVFFASVQGYGPKGYGMGAYVYPGSGATCDTKQVNKPPGEEINEMDEDTPSVQEIEEDPDAEFCYQGGEMPRTEGPRIIDVGIPGPGHHVPMWKRSWRDKIFPALVKFEPDLILLSAGFDAHRKDDINFSYIGIQEKDFEWITDQVVQIANRCCHGRVVSVLEGGYRIQGNIVSAFARSVAAHVRALSEMNLQEWDPIDAKFEREREKKLRAEAEAKRLADEAEAKRLAEEAEAARQAAAAVNATNADGAPAMDNSDPAAMSPEAGGRQKRRRSTVDYVALNKKLQEEEQAKKPSS